MTNDDLRAALADELGRRMSLGTSGRYILDYGLTPDDLAGILAAHATPSDAPQDAGLSEAERRSLRCRCTRLDGGWHHHAFCVVPAVERILAARIEAEREVAQRQAAIAVAREHHRMVAAYEPGNPDDYPHGGRLAARADHGASATGAGEEAVVRTNRYTVKVDGHAVRATPSQEQRLRAMDAEQRSRFLRVMGVGE